MGFTRARRYANHKGGRKYAKETDASGKKVQLPRGEEDPVKAESVRSARKSSADLAGAHLQRRPCARQSCASCPERSLIAQDEKYIELVERHRELEWATHDAQADDGGDVKPKASTSRRSEPSEDEESDEDVKPARSRRSVKDEDDYVP